MGTADKDKDYPGRVACEKSGESIYLAFNTAVETINHGMTFESRTKSTQEEKARHDIYEKKLATHSFRDDVQGESLCYTIIVCSNTQIT